MKTNKEDCWVLNGKAEYIRPTALAIPPRTMVRGVEGAALWFSTGKDIRRMMDGAETVVLGDTKDVSAMTFTNDGTLWLATHAIWQSDNC